MPIWRVPCSALCSLAGSPICWGAEAVLHHTRPLPRRHRRNLIRAGFHGVCAVPLSHGLRNRGEYVAINSAIQELIPARYRGRTDLAINGSFWLGAVLGVAGNADPADAGTIRARRWLAARVSVSVPCWARSFWCSRRSLPKSPRWLMVHGRVEEAERIVGSIERDAADCARPRPTRAWRVAMAMATDRGGPDTYVRRAATRARRYLVCAFTPATAQPISSISLSRYSSAIPKQRSARPGPDGSAGLLLQRDFLHVRPRTGDILWRAGRRSGALHPPVRRLEFRRAAGAGLAVRPLGAQAHDRRHLRNVRPATGCDGIPVRQWLAHRSDSDHRVFGHVLLRLLRRELGVSHRSARAFRWRCGRWPSPSFMRSGTGWAA